MPESALRESQATNGSVKNVAYRKNARGPRQRGQSGPERRHAQHRRSKGKLQTRVAPGYAIEIGDSRIEVKRPGDARNNGPSMV